MIEGSGTGATRCRRTRPNVGSILMAMACKGSPLLSCVGYSPARCPSKARHATSYNPPAGIDAMAVPIRVQEHKRPRNSNSASGFHAFLRADRTMTTCCCYRRWPCFVATKCISCLSRISFGSCSSSCAKAYEIRLANLNLNSLGALELQGKRHTSSGSRRTDHAATHQASVDDTRTHDRPHRRSPLPPCPLTRSPRRSHRPSASPR